MMRENRLDSQTQQSVRKIVDQFKLELQLNNNFKAVDSLFTAFTAVTASHNPTKVYFETLSNLLEGICTATGSDIGMLLRDSVEEPLHFKLEAWFSATLARPAADVFAVTPERWAKLSRDLGTGLVIDLDTDLSAQFSPPLPIQDLKLSVAVDSQLVRDSSFLPEIAGFLIGDMDEPGRALLMLGKRKHTRSMGDVENLPYRDQHDILGLISRRLNEAYNNAQNLENYQHFTQDVMHQLNNSFGSLAYEVARLKDGKVKLEEYPATFSRLFEIVQLFRNHIETGVASASSRSLIEVYGTDPELYTGKDFVRLLRQNQEFFIGKASSYKIDGPRIDEESFENFPPIQIYEELFDLVIFNLFDNAVKYTVREANLPIEVVGSVEKDGVRISITNHGIAVREEDRHSIFKRYERSKTARGYASYGTGIGLHICSEIMTLHGGTIEVQPSAPSPLHTRADEVTFTLWFPFAEDFVSATSTEVEQQQSRPTLLFVEDDHWEMESLLRSLQESFDVIEARNFEAARSYMIGHQRKIRIILLDIGLKDPNQISPKETDTAGIDFAEWVLNDAALSKIPIIVHTASSVPQIARHLKDMGVKEVIRKGRISPDGLIDMMLSYLEPKE